MTLELQLLKVRGARDERNVFVFLLVICHQPTMRKWKMHRGFASCPAGYTRIGQCVAWNDVSHGWCRGIVAQVSGRVLW